MAPVAPTESTVSVAHAPDAHAWEVAAQSVRAPVYAEPVALQVVATVPSHAGWFGLQTCGLHATAIGSQYEVAMQVETSDEVVPSAEHMRMVLASQKRMLGVHISATQLPIEQICDVAVQSVCAPVKPEPSALQVVAKLPLHAG
jgi:predicted trehalose synthase